MRSLEEFPASERPSLESLLERNRRHLERLLSQGAFRDTGGECLFIYRLRVDDHEQVGLVGEVPVDEYDQGVIKQHEHTQTNREEQLVRYNEVVGAASSPVCLTYAHHPGIDAVTTQWMKSPPVIDFVADDGVAQAIWCVDDRDVQERLRQYFIEVGEAYLTDGHHRAAAAFPVCTFAAAAESSHTGDEPYNYLLVALFPDDQVRILAYNRYVTDLNGITVDELLDALNELFEVEYLGDVPAGQAEPSRPREFTMLLEERWYRLRVDPSSIAEADPVDSLDITILHERVLGPILGIADVRCDERCESVSGASGMAGLAERCRGAEASPSPVTP
jgi:uncharacterized protein (DUF1015 family)